MPPTTYDSLGVVGSPHMVGVQCRFSLQLDLRRYYELHIDDWDRYIMLGEHDFVPASAQELKPTLAVMYPAIHDVAAEDAAKIIAQQTLYHLSIGFDTVHAYITHDMVGAFTDHSKLAIYLRTGELQLLLWNDLPSCTATAVCNKVVALNHFILAMWGFNTRVLMLDADELVALPTQMRMPDLKQRCWGNVSMAGFMRLNVLCDSCAAGELQLWQTASKDLLMHYNRRLGYELESKTKSLLTPDAVHAIDIHMGDILSGEYHRLPVEECGQILHFQNMFRDRAEGQATEFSEWQWALSQTPH